MKAFKKILAMFLVMAHILTYSVNAQEYKVVNGDVTHLGDVTIQKDQLASFTVIDLTGKPMLEGHGIFYFGNFENFGNIDTLGQIAFVAQEILNAGNISSQGAFLLTTLGINEKLFFEGVVELSKTPEFSGGAIVNSGEIRSLTQDVIALVAANGGVHNMGTISSNGGVVALVAGDQVSFPLTRDGALNIKLEGISGVEGQIFDNDGKPINTKGLITNSGLLQAHGGIVILQATGAEAIYDSIINHTGIIEAKSVAQENGKIILKSETGNIHVNDATMDVSGLSFGEKGGSIKVLTKGNIVVDGKTMIDASGDQGGGEVLIGGGAHGTGDTIAKNVGIGQDVIIQADAVTHGDGGKIVAYANHVTNAFGSFSAKGGVEGGNGGFIETSGKEFLRTDGVRVDASASHGNAGKWLLDPYNIIVVAGNGLVNTSGANNFSPTGDTSTIGVDQINTQLNQGTDVTLFTGFSGSSGAQSGDITINAPIAISSGKTATLTLVAWNNIVLNGSMIATGAGSILNIILNIHKQNPASQATINQTINTPGSLTMNTDLLTFGGASMTLGALNIGSKITSFTFPLPTGQQGNGTGGVLNNGDQGALNSKAFVRALRPYSDFDTNYSADVPAYTNYENLAFSPDIAVNTVAIDQISLRGITTAPRVVPLPVSAQPAPPQPTIIGEDSKAAEVLVFAKEPKPPAVVPIPAKATPSGESKTQEGVPKTPKASN